MTTPATRETRRALPVQQREASFQPATLNEEARTVELVWSTGAKVRRYDWWEDRYYDEELSLDVAHVRMERLNAGAPLLKDHRASLDNIIGVVVRAWIENGEGRALVRFSERADVAAIIADVKAGILRNISVGYAVRKYEIVKEEGAVDIYRAVDWEPQELSFVAIPADADAQVRSAPQPGAERTECIFINRAQPATQGAATMADPTEKPAGTPVDPINADQVRSEAIAAERTRTADITALCKRHNVALADKLIADGSTVEQARAAVLEHLAARDAAGTAPRTPQIQTVQDEVDVRRAGVENAILNRAAPGKHKLDDNGRQYRGLSLLEVGRSLLEAQGINTRGLDKMEIATRSMQATGDFPAILANVANKTLRAAYENAPQTFRPFTKQASAPDFKQIQRTQVGDAPTLKKVNEHGEFTYGTIGEGKETYQLATYGRIIAITRQAIINDDLSAFTDMPAKFGRAAANLESDIVWGIVTANAAMADGVALFHADHGNLAAANAVIAVASLGIGRAAMRKQTSLDGQLINVMPQFLLVPAALETVAQQYTSAAYVSTKGADINPFSSTLQVIAEPRLDASSATAWYLAADPAQIDTIEYCYLDGNEGVYLETRNGFEVDGMEIKARLDFAAKAIDHRGLWKNVGA
ncbi:prohead protease/major capsid protein fusion protein [Aromatoleum toluclasticum]|uniref:prohead protease/major capsid protein fusion protein n=1 Tax=Aromatoleum toluclasticum TaxID=92003 RepID=UPI00037CCD4D|nr:prohead protease/major capsid protein fusion protein [Aromatoleum toluclasticum]